MVAILTMVQEVEKDCFSQALIAWVARREAHCEPMHSEIVSARVLWAHPLIYYQYRGPLLFTFYPEYSGISVLLKFVT